MEVGKSSGSNHTEIYHDGLPIGVTDAAGKRRIRLK